MNNDGAKTDLAGMVAASQPKPTGTIALPCFGIIIQLDGGGGITSDLKDTCSFCGQSDCNFHCDDSQGAGDEDPDNTETEHDVADRMRFNAQMDAIAAMILAHAIAGMNVTKPAYLEGIEIAVQACRIKED